MPTVLKINAPALAHIVARAAYLGVSQPGMERGKS